jgi:hypothetical protein
LLLGGRDFGRDEECFSPRMLSRRTSMNAQKMAAPRIATATARQMAMARSVELITKALSRCPAPNDPSKPSVHPDRLFLDQIPLEIAQINTMTGIKFRTGVSGRS